MAWTNTVLVFVACAVFATAELPSHIKRQETFLRTLPPRQRAFARKAYPGTLTSMIPLPLDRTINPIGYGADPTGRNDSSSAFIKAVDALTALCEGSAVRDCGGAVLDLAGGEFALSSPVVVPQGYANYAIARGSLIALPNFAPADAPLLHVGAGCTPKGHSGVASCSNDVTIEQLAVDARHFAGGGILVEDTMYANVGPGLLVQGFHDYGVSFPGSGGSMLHQSWIGQYSWTESSLRSNATATGVAMDGPHQHDCYVTDVIVFSARVGVAMANGANQISGVHTWNLSGKLGGTGILLEKGGGRVINSYLDFAPLVIVNPKGVIVANNLFLGEANVILRAEQGVSCAVKHLRVTDNWFHSANTTVIVDETNATFTNITDVTISGNIVQDGTVSPSTEARIGHWLGGATTTTLDFSHQLLFAKAPIVHAQCTLQGSEPVAVAVHPSGLTLDVTLASPSHDRIECVVQQSLTS